MTRHAAAGARPAVRRARGQQLAALLAALVLAAGCARHPQPPTPASPPGPVNLTGAKVVILPAQAGGGTPTEVADAFDAELAYWLADRTPRAHWIAAADVERLVRNSPAIRIDLHALDVRSFARMHVQRIGDPLFGDVHDLGALFDAPLALVPTHLDYVSEPDSSAATARGPGHLEVAAALIQTFGGEVVWQGVVAGKAGRVDAPATAATAARALARALTSGN